MKLIHIIWGIIFAIIGILFIYGFIVNTHREVTISNPFKQTLQPDELIFAGQTKEGGYFCLFDSPDEGFKTYLNIANVTTERDVSFRRLNKIVLIDKDRNGVVDSVINPETYSKNEFTLEMAQEIYKPIISLFGSKLKDGEILW